MPKRNHFFFVLVFFLVFLTVAGVNVRAHPPDDMTLNFNAGTNTLSVTIIHGVADNTTHFIVSVEVKVNGSTDQTQFYGSQPNLTSFTYEYTVITNAGSLIEVTAVCSVGGSLTRTLGGTSGPENGAIPGYLGLYLVIVFSVISLLVIFRRRLKREQTKSKN
jgi:hypothetical protein